MSITFLAQKTKTIISYNEARVNLFLNPGIKFQFDKITFNENCSSCYILSLVSGRYPQIRNMNFMLPAHLKSEQGL